MFVYQQLILAIMAVSTAVFIALFGRLPVFRKTPIGLLHRYLLHVLPKWLKHIDSIITGGRIVSSMKSSGHYLMHENHPLVLIFYLTVLSGSIALFLPAAFPQITTIYRVAAAVLVCSSYYLTYRSVMSTSSIITLRNHSTEIDRYPYDHVLYLPGQICRTCLLTKPARSKHCGVCNVCISKHDHHCVWVMNCLGKGNYAYFLGLLASLGTTLNYGAYLAYIILKRNLEVQRTNGTLPMTLQASPATWSDYGQQWSWIFAQDVRIGAIGLLALLTGPLAWGLFVYHIYLIWAGMTTNESSKWADWRDDVYDGLVYKRRTRGLDSQKAQECATSGEASSWPAWKTTEVKLCLDRRPPESNGNPLDHRDEGQKHSEWHQVRSLNELENLYDLGFLQNLRDSLSSI